MSLHGFDDDDEFGFQKPQWNKKEMDEQIRRFREAMRGGDSRSQSPSPSALEELVLYCLETEKFDDALNFANLLIESMPYSSDSWQKKGIALTALSRYEEALEALNHANAVSAIPFFCHESLE